MRIGSNLPHLDGYPFEVRYSKGAENRARAAADWAKDAYAYLSNLLGVIEPDLAVVVANESDWNSRQPYGLPFFNDDPDQIRPGIIVMPASRGSFWVEMGYDLRDSSPEEYPRLLEQYPDGSGGLDLQPFFDLVTIHEMGHAFEVLGGVHLPTFWLSEIFANLALHTFVATQRPQSLALLEVLPSVGATSARLDERMRAEGHTSLEDLDIYYTGGSEPMSPLNYVWYQYRWQRIAAAVFDADGEEALRRMSQVFQDRPGDNPPVGGRIEIAELLSARVSETLGRAIELWE